MPLPFQNPKVNKIQKSGKDSSCSLSCQGGAYKKQSRKKSGSAKTYVKDLFAFLAVTSAAVTPAAVGTSATAVLASLCMSIGSHACVR